MTNTYQTRKKTTYSTFTKYCCQKGVLSKDIEKRIPRSTRNTWHKQRISVMEDSLLAGFENESLDYAELITKNEETKALSAALTEIILVYQKIVDSSDAKKQLLAQNKHLILETVERFRSIFGFHKLCNYLGISLPQYYAWKNNADCRASLLKLCRKKFPAQLTDKDVKTIRTYMNNDEFQFLSRATVYWKIIRDGAAMFSKTAFYKYCKLLGYNRRPMIDKSKRNAEGIRAEAPAEILHTDITYVVTADEKTSYLSFVEDNFSKCILSGQASKTPTSAFVKNNIEDVINRYNLINPGLTLITDNGGENKGELDVWLKTEMRTIKKIIARVDIPQANNVIEALHKKFKNEFLQGKKFANHEALVAALPDLIETYNNQYHDSLYGCSPLEVWNGAVPDKNKYHPLFMKAKEIRKDANRGFNCCMTVRTF